VQRWRESCAERRPLTVGRWFWLGVAWLACDALACEHRSSPPAPAEPASEPTAKALARNAPGPAEPASIGKPLNEPPAAGARATADTLGPHEAVYVCVDNTGSQVVQRVALPGGEAFVVSHGRDGWRVSEGQRLPAKALGELAGAANAHHFFDFPERFPEHEGQGFGGREWDLWLGSPSRRHHSHRYQARGQELPAYQAFFSLCERSFASLRLRQTDLRGAIAIYRTLEDYARGLEGDDPRRALLIDWLDSLQADYASP
jgi:hypothetical protein